MDALQEFRRTQHVGQVLSFSLQQMPVAADHCVRCGGVRQGDQVIVVGIFGERRYLVALIREYASLPEPQNILEDLLVGEPVPKPGTQQHSLQLVEKAMRNDQLETLPHPKDEQVVWRSPGDRRADEYAGVQDDAGYGGGRIW